MEIFAGYANTSVCFNHIVSVLAAALKGEIFRQEDENIVIPLAFLYIPSAKQEISFKQREESNKEKLQ